MQYDPHPMPNASEAPDHQTGQTSARAWPPKYEAVAQTWNTMDEGQAILLSGLDRDEVNTLRRLFYDRFGKTNVLVRSVEQEDGMRKAVIRPREGREYLWGDAE
ncbi:MAG: hypothetical protein R6T83_09670 [Salinibacter sp.]